MTDFIDDALMAQASIIDALVEDPTSVWRDDGREFYRLDIDGWSINYSLPLTDEGDVVKNTYPKDSELSFRRTDGGNGPSFSAMGLTGICGEDDFDPTVQERFVSSMLGIVDSLDEMADSLDEWERELEENDLYGAKSIIEENKTLQLILARFAFENPTEVTTRNGRNFYHLKIENDELGTVRIIYSQKSPTEGKDPEFDPKTNTTIRDSTFLLTQGKESDAVGFSSIGLAGICDYHHWEVGDGRTREQRESDSQINFNDAMDSVYKNLFS